MIYQTITTEELILKVELPLIRFRHGKGTRLWLFNYVLPMNNLRYSRMHGDMLKEYTELLKPLCGFPVYKNSIFRIKTGYIRGKNWIDGKKTKTIDIEGIVACQKVAVDALIKVSAIPSDSIFHIDQTTQKYMGEREYEGIFFQVTRFINEEISRVEGVKDEKCK